MKTIKITNVPTTTNMIEQSGFFLGVDNQGKFFKTAKSNIVISRTISLSTEESYLLIAKTSNPFISFSGILTVTKTLGDQVFNGFIGIEKSSTPGIFAVRTSNSSFVGYKVTWDGEEYIAIKKHATASREATLSVLKSLSPYTFLNIPATELTNIVKL